MTQTNPFAGYASMVDGDRFYGRASELEEVANRVAQEGASGSLAIIGEPRIGKSSLAHQAVIAPRDELVKRRILPIWVAFGTFEGPVDVFCSLVKETQRELEDTELITGRINRAYDRFREVDRASWTDLKFEIEGFFRAVRREKIRVIFVLDEFDRARTIFRDEMASFQLLRSLADEPELKITLITTSRRRLYSIETKSDAISNLDGIFHKIYLRGFRDDELAGYWERLGRVGIELSPDERTTLLEYTGTHPYLLAMIGFGLAKEKLAGNPVDVAAVCRQTSPLITDYYVKVLDLLREEGYLNKLVQVLFGPNYDVTRNEEADLEQYGLIVKHGEGYRTFSQHFEDYLRAQAREIKPWPLWSETETGLRLLVGTFLREKFGADWLPGVLKARPKLKAIFDGCQELQQRDMRVQGMRASGDLLEFTYPKQLYDLMQIEWDWFRQVLRGEKAEWEANFNALQKIRNPLAHNRMQAVSEGDRNRAVGICQILLERIGEWQAAQAGKGAT